jgi:hypothetical protein
LRQKGVLSPGDLKLLADAEAHIAKLR